MGLADLFISVESLPQNGYGFIQLCFLGGVYGYLLMYASNLISDGSELLLLIPAWAGLIGSVVLPILGAVPDGCIVLFSGMGPNAQGKFSIVVVAIKISEQLSVGVGALAGSTIMLLTIPWFLSILGGRVNIDNDGKPHYRQPKLIPSGNASLTGTGVGISDAVNKGAYIMIITSIGYFLLQVPGLVYLGESTETISEQERVWAMFGTITCTTLFLSYLYYQYILSKVPDNTQDKIREARLIEMIADKKVTLLAVMTAEFEEYLPAAARAKSERFPPSHNNTSSASGYQMVQTNETTPLNRAASAPNTRVTLPDGSSMTRVASISQLPSDQVSKRLHHILKPFFRAYDRDNGGTLNMKELLALFNDLGEKLSAKQLAAIFSQYDTNQSGDIDYEEFVQGTAYYIMNHMDILRNYRRSGGHTAKIEEGLVASQDEAEEGSEEEEEIPEDIKDLSPEEQQRKILQRAFWMMGLGTAIVLLVSDPTVDVLSELGKRTGIPAFYIAFVLAPLASNASELIAAYNYAQKKTLSSITISLATLEGACVMNNTFVLGIFTFLIWHQRLAWEYFAETASILFVILVIAVLALKKSHTLLDGCIILALYPISLVLVATLESMGWT